MNKQFSFIILSILTISTVACTNNNIAEDTQNPAEAPQSQSQHIHDSKQTANFKASYEKSIHQMHDGMTIDDKYMNNPDYVFAKGMLAHHEGAVAMAKVQLQHGKDPELLKLANAIIQAQTDEIKFMQKWLKQHPVKK